MFNFVPPEQLTAEARDELDAKAAARWDIFYQRHAEKFFRDRHYLDKELPALANAGTILEVGCGVGNTVYPLLEVCRPETVIYACDFSATAVDLVRSHPMYDPKRVRAFVADLTRDSLGTSVPPGGIEMCTLVFVLSAIAPSEMQQAIRNIARTLVPGSGRIFFRDYAQGDLAEARLHKVGRTRRLEPSAYCRNDGTRTYFFSHAEVRQLFAAEGFRCDDIVTHQRTISNRARELTMERQWVQATFTYVGPAQEGAAAAVPLGRQCHASACGAAQSMANGTGGSLAHCAAGAAAGSAARTAGSADGSPASGLVSSTTDAAVAPGAAGARAIPSAPGAGDQPSAAAPAPQHEWEGSTSGGVVGSDLADLFHEPVEMQEVVEELRPGLALRLALMPRQHCHTQSHTALMVWQAARPLAQLLLRCPTFFQWKSVLELGCGAAGLAAVAATRSARRIVCTDGSADALRLLGRNLSANAHLFMAERIILRQLVWDNVRHIAALQEEFPFGFDIVCGTDVVYAAAGIPSLFAAAAALLSESPRARVMLCHTARSVSEEVIVQYAGHAGLKAVQGPSEVVEAAAALGISEQSAMRLLWFQRRQES